MTILQTFKVCDDTLKMSFLLTYFLTSVNNLSSHHSVVFPTESHTKIIRSQIVSEEEIWPDWYDVQESMWL